MASPSMTFGSAGNFHPSASLGAGAGVWEWTLGLSTKLEGHLRVSATPGASMSTTRGLAVDVYAYGATVPTIQGTIALTTASTAHVQTFFIPTGRWAVLFSNLDGTYAITVEATLDTVDGIG